MSDYSVRAILSLNTSQFTGPAKQATDAVKSLGDAMQKSSSLSQSQTSALAKVGVGAVAATAAFAGAGAAALKTYADFDKAFSAVMATGDEAKAAAGGLKQAAMSQSDLGYTATQAVSAEEALIKAGVSVGDVMGGALRGSLALAAAGQMDVGDAAEVASLAMVQFNLQGKDVGHIADVIAAGAGKAAGSVPDMAMALKQGGLVASQFGLSLEETAGSLAAFASAGLIGSDAGTSLKTMLLKLAQPSAEASREMERLGIHMYDADGKFVGMAGAADQLRAGLGNLTDEQRQSALATIFGTDAIRAASILYSQGGDGIRDWTKQVNDQGYAAKVAADQTNNLKGDLDKFRAAIEKDIINGAGGANTALRDLTKGATSFASALGKIPAPVIETIAGISVAATGVVAAVTLASKAFDAFNTAKEAVAGLKAMIEASGDSVGAFAGRTAGGIGVITAAIAAGIAATSAMQTDLDKSVSGINMDDMAARLRDFGTAAKSTETDMAGFSYQVQGSSDALDKFFVSDHWQFANMGHQIVDGVTGLSSAMATLHSENTKPGFDKAFESMVGGIFHAKTPLQELQAIFGKMDDALVGMNRSAESTAAFQRIADQAKAAGVSADELVAQFPKMAAQYRAAAADLIGADKAQQMSAQELVDWMGGKVPPAIKAASDATGKHKDLTQQDAQAAQDAAQHLKDLTDQYEKQAQEALGASNADIAYQDAIAKVNEQAAKGAVQIDAATGKIDLHTKAGRDAQTALNGLAEAALKSYDAAIKDGEGNEAAAAKMNEGKQAYINAAMAMGMSRDAAQQLADKIFAIPTEKTAKVNTRADTSGVDQANAALNSVQDRDVWIRIHRADIDAATTARGMGDEGTPGNFAYGGLVGGYSPHMRADNIPASLTAGEFVFDVPAVRRVGISNLYGMLSGRISAADIKPHRRYAYGGMVEHHQQSRASAYAYGGMVAAVQAGPQITFAPQISEHLSLMRQWEAFQNQVARGI